MKENLQKNQLKSIWNRVIINPSIAKIEDVSILEGDKRKI